MQKLFTWEVILIITGMEHMYACVLAGLPAKGIVSLV